MTPILTEWSTDDVTDSIRQLDILAVFRKDRLSAGLSMTSKKVLGQDLLSIVENKSLGEIILSSAPQKPIAICAPSDKDETERILALAPREKVETVAMGSQECIEIAERAIVSAMQKGSWVLLINCHLVPDWLRRLIDRYFMSNLDKVHADFRLVLTMVTSNSVPTSFIRASTIVMVSPVYGIKMNVQRHLRSLSIPLTVYGAHAQSLFALSWLHTLIGERLRFVPLGWTKSYEFSDADLHMAAQLLSAIHRSSGKQEERTKTIKGTLSSAVYGGLLETPEDEHILAQLLDQTFDEHASVLYGEDAIVLPKCKVDEKRPLHQWIEEWQTWLSGTLRDTYPPSSLGLPDGAESVELITKADRLIAQFRHLSQL